MLGNSAAILLLETDRYALVTLDFTRCDLTGSLPTELGALESMAILGLGRNDFTGSIPSELGRLSNLGTHIEP